MSTSIDGGEYTTESFYELLCRNPHVDVDALTWKQLEAARLDLAPYMMHHPVVWLTEIGLVGGLTLLVSTIGITFAFRPRSRRRVSEERETLAALE